MHIALNSVSLHCQPIYAREYRSDRSSCHYASDIDEN